MLGKISAFKAVCTLKLWKWQKKKKPSCDPRGFDLKLINKTDVVSDWVSGNASARGKEICLQSDKESNGLSDRREEAGNGWHFNF